MSYLCQGLQVDFFARLKVHDFQFYWCPCTPHPFLTQHFPFAHSVFSIQFKSEVKRLFAMPPDADFEVNFSVPAPSFGRAQTSPQGSRDLLSLRGLQQYGGSLCCAR
jgi:hypothetical protein